MQTAPTTKKPRQYHNPPPTDRSRLIRLPEVKARVGLSRGSIYNRIKDGSFPAPISLGGKSVAWLESAIDAYIDNLVAAAAKRAQ